MVKYLIAAFVFSLLFVQPSPAASPPEFPGGMETTLTFTESGAGLPLANRRVEISFADVQIPETAIRTAADGSATLFLPPGISSAHASASCDEPETPGLDYLSQPFEMTAGARVEMVPIGVVTGSVRDENGTKVSADVAFDCANKALPTPMIQTDSLGRFNATLPAGQCTISASVQGMDGTSSVTVRRGESSQADILLRTPANPPSGPSLSPELQFTAFLVLLVLLVIAFVAYYYLSRRPAARRPSKAHKTRKARKGGLRLLLFLAIILPISQAATISNNVAAGEHTYDLLQSLGHVPNMRLLTATGTPDSADGCTGDVIVEISDDGRLYAAIGSAETVSPQRFSLTFSNTGAHHYVRIRNPDCKLASTSLQIVEKPDITISSLRLIGEPKTGVPGNIIATIRNAGGQLDAGRPTIIIVRFYDTTMDQQHMIGEIPLNRSEAVWGENGSSEVSVVWTPPLLGTRTIYVSAFLSPPVPGLESDERNNLASIGIFVQAGPGESRATTLELSTAPAAALYGQAGPIRINAIYDDSLTRQPVLGANCTVSEAGKPGGHPMEQSGTGYSWEWDEQSPQIGVYEFSASCGKSGYAPANGTSFLPLNSPGGQQVLIRQDERVFRGTIVTQRSAIGQAPKLKIRIERNGPELAGFGRESVTINNYPAVSLETDAQLREGRYWLEPGSTFAEWTFEMDRISGDFLTLAFEPELLPARPTAITVFLTPVQVLCTRRQATVEIQPRERTGEVGTALFYQVVVRNNDDRECSPTEFSLTDIGGRAGWRYILSSSRILVQPGRSNITFISVEPPLGEQPGTYTFRLRAEDPEWHSGPRFEEPPEAGAAYTVSSPRLFAGLEAGIVGESTLPAGPGAFFEFYARYYNITNSSIGSCRLASDLVGAEGMLMDSNGTHFLLVLNLSGRAPGAYPYIIECEAPAHKPLAFAGNLTLAPPTSSKRYPLLSLTPKMQRASGNSTIAFIARISNMEECNGTKGFSLRATPPAGWNAGIEGDSPGIWCGAEAESLVHLSLPADFQRVLHFIPITAAYSADARFATTSYALVASSQSEPRVLSCVSGDADESAKNLESTGDTCWNWNIAHTYSLHAAGGALVLAGRTAREDCESTVSIEASENGISFEKVAQVPATSASDFNLTIENKNYSRVRFADEKCRLARSALMYAGPSTGSPELSFAGVDFPAFVQGSKATVKAAIRNTGQSTYSSYTAGIALKAPDGETIPLDFKTVFSHASNSDQEVVFEFTPKTSGIFDLVLTADYANEINESDKSDNSLTIPNIAIKPAPRAVSTTISPGWNVIPFISGIAPSHNCTFSDAYAFDAKSKRMLPLNPGTLAFISTSDADSIIASHGTAFAPRDAGAFGGAWVYSEEACELAFSLANASAQSRQSFSQLKIPEGDNLLAVLPWMAGNTPGDIFSSCGCNIWEWNAPSQRWSRRGCDSPFTQEDIGSAMLLRANSTCKTG